MKLKTTLTKLISLQNFSNRELKIGFDFQVSFWQATRIESICFTVSPNLQTASVQMSDQSNN